MERFSKKEKEYVLEALNSGLHSSMVRRLEEKFSEVFGCRYAISFVNGTATMHAALVAAGIGTGDEVIVPPLTFASTALAVVHAGALPVFADVDHETWTINPTSIKKMLTERTKAVIPVSLYGLAPDMDAIMNIANERKLFVLEDNAECFLGYYKGQVVGSIGHASSFSFEASKHMTSGQGGMVTTDDPELATAIRRFGALGYGNLKGSAKDGTITKDVLQDPSYERHVSLGWNYIMSELCAAVALGQLERLDELVSMRIQVAKLYSQAISGCSWLQCQKVPENYIHTYWTYVLRLNHPDITWKKFRTEFMKLGGDPMYAAWLPTYLEPVLKGKKLNLEQQQTFESGLCPVAESIQPQLFQFKTNYFELDDAKRQADALRMTIDSFN